MAERYLIDTLTWRDYWENRKDRFRPLGEWALDFVKKAMEEGDKIIYTDFTEDELKRDYDEEKIKEVFRVIDKVNLLKKVEVKPNQFREAAKLSKERKVPFGDALHAIVARDIGAIVITRDHHYEELQDIAVSKKPEELIYSIRH